VIIVSHRGPYSFTRDADGSFVARRGGGGIVSSLLPLGASRPDLTWLAAAMTADDTEAMAAGAGDGLALGVRLVDLDPDLHHLHYNVVANQVLWFLFHGLFDRTRRPVFDIAFRAAWEAYAEVNERFAEAAADLAPPGETVLVQDFQLMLVPGMLRARRPDLRIAHFTHIPFCSADDMRMLPTDVARDLCASLASGPAGFHTHRWAAQYHDTARAVLGPGVSVRPPFVASLGPDIAALAAVADSAEGRTATRAVEDAAADRLVVARTDRIEPSKNIVRGFLAYDRLLEARPGLRGRVVFLASVYPSRQDLDEYARYTAEINEVVARVNDRWGTRDWHPVILDDSDHFPTSLAVLRRSDVLLVNPLRDGLNLVAKEGPACNRRDGVLCLSTEAGAYEELRDAAVTVHPYDIEQTAGALDDALTLPLDERATRASHLRRLATARTPADWLGDLVRHAGE